MQIQILNGHTDDLNAEADQFGLGVVHYEAGQ